MCGIVGIVTRYCDKKTEVVDFALSALEILEYRGYDSVGIAALQSIKPDGGSSGVECDFKFMAGNSRSEGTLDKDIDNLSNLQNQKFLEIRTLDRIVSLKQQFANQKGNYGDFISCIGHSRWATHGSVSIANTHPIICDNLAIVHNGTIENYREIRQDLEVRGYTFDSETDTEVIVVLAKTHMDSGLDLVAAIEKVVQTIKGMYAFVICNKDIPNFMIGVRNGLALNIGFDEGLGLCCFTSDVIAMPSPVNKVIQMEDSEILIVDFTAKNAKEVLYVKDFAGQKLNKFAKSFTHCKDSVIDKGEFKHFMMKEIYQQSDIIEKLIGEFYLNDRSDLSIKLQSINFDLYDHFCFIACGSSYYASCIGKYLIEEMTDKIVLVELASEFRSRRVQPIKNCLYIFVSQSGETADVIASLNKCKAFSKDGHNIFTVGIVNVETSQIAQNVDITLQNGCGAEVAVASTKVFSSQVLMMLFLALSASVHNADESHDSKGEGVEKSQNQGLLYDLSQDIKAIRSQMHFLELQVNDLSKSLLSASHIICLGRGVMYPIALEAALKIKELSYIPSEGIAAGELKHGPIALIEKGVPVIIFSEDFSERGGSLSSLANIGFGKLLNNIEEIAAREGDIVFVGSAISIERLKHIKAKKIEIPALSRFGNIVAQIIGLQMLSYYIALNKGVDVDKPRNLAKSVTVE